MLKNIVFKENLNFAENAKKFDTILLKY